MLKIFLKAALAQILAAAFLIGSSQLYWHIYKEESWPVLIPALFIGLTVETFLIKLSIEVKSYSPIIIRIVGSWIFGALSFLFLDDVVLGQAPVLAFILSISLLVYMLDRLQAALD